MISYETAKKLKDAGFPQEGEGFESENLDSAATSGVNVFRENVYVERNFCPEENQQNTVLINVRQKIEIKNLMKELKIKKVNLWLELNKK